MPSAKLLLVEDDAQQRESTADWLAHLGHRVEAVATVEAALRAAGRKPFDLVLCDVRLPDGDGFRVAEQCRRLPRPVPVVLVTGAASVQTGVQALRCGAADLIVKPYLDAELETAVERVLKTERAAAENARLREELDRRSRLEDVVGDDPRMRRIFDLVERVASSRTTVLLTGESGTGKSLIARAIHRSGARSSGPFVEVACGALPETLLESELFGHAAGSFTGAAAARVGRFQQADKGTIFLDEIGTASAALQVKLLRVLQEMEFEPVGGANTVRVDSRVVLATNEDLAKRVAEGTFRQDLFYRINVVAIELPPLRERRGDLPLLCDHLLDRLAENVGRRVHSVAPDAMAALQQYAWPGNIRELENVLERAVLLGNGDRVELVDLPPAIAHPSSGRSDDSTASVSELKRAMQAPERRLILDALAQAEGNRAQTARTLGINRATLYKKMKRLGLEP